MEPAKGCSAFSNDSALDTAIGILRYEDSDENPTTSKQVYGLDCRDEKYGNLVPIVPWHVGKPSNERKNFSMQLIPPGDI
jgi:hypothetical protein